MPTIDIYRERRNVMYTSYNVIQIVVCYCHRNNGNQCDISRKNRFIKLIHVIPWQHRTPYLNTSNHYNIIRVRKHFTDATYVRFMLYMYTV